MCVARDAAVQRRTDRRTVHRPNSAVAAWFLGLPGGTVLLTVNSPACQAPGSAECAESWFRLHALVRGRPFGVLTVTEVRADGERIAGHQHAAID